MDRVRLSMKPVDRRPFLVPSGERRMTNNANNQGDVTPLPKRASTARASTARSSSVRDVTVRLSSVRAAAGRLSSVRVSTTTAGPRRTTARKLLIPTAATSRSRNSSRVAGATRVGAIPVSGGGTRKSTAGAANLDKDNSLFRAEEGVDAVATNMPRTTGSTVKYMGADANNKRFAINRTLQQPQLWQQQPVKPAGEANSIQAERQKRRNRGLGYVGMQGLPIFVKKNVGLSLLSVYVYAYASRFVCARLLSECKLLRMPLLSVNWGAIMAL